VSKFIYAAHNIQMAELSYEALYCCYMDMCSQKEEYEAAISEMRVKMELLLCENAKLRKQLQDLQDQGSKGVVIHKHTSIHVIKHTHINCYMSRIFMLFWYFIATLQYCHDAS
jgi:hypothetical protein